MSDAYARAGVDTGEARGGVGALVAALSRIDTGRPSRSLVPSGHYASVLALDELTAVAICTDGVGTKLIVAEAMNRFDTVGIDCVAMNVNDLVCVGAEPIALVDYVAVEQADEAMLAALGEGLREGATQAGDRDPRRRAGAGAGDAARPSVAARPRPRRHGDRRRAARRDRHRGADRAGRPGDRRPVERPALERLHRSRAARCASRAASRSRTRRRSWAARSPTSCSSRP